MNTKSRVSDRPTEEAADSLVNFDQLHKVLTETHVTIPQLLNEERAVTRDLGLAESRADSGAIGDLRGRLDDVARQRQATVRKRVASVEGLLQLESALRADRAAVESERERIAGEVARAFGERWQRACQTLSDLRAEALVLGRALRMTVATPAPYVPFMHPIRERPELRPVAGPEPPPVALPAHLTTLVRRLDGLDEALARIGAVKQAKLLDSRHYDLCRVRGTPPEYPGVYLVTGAFDSLIDGMKFDVGELIDSSVVGPGTLARLAVARRYVRPADLVA